MIINEPEEKRLERLAAYEACKKRGHSASVGIGPYQVCDYCGTHYRFVLEEVPSTVPTNRNVPEGNHIRTVAA